MHRRTARARPPTACAGNTNAGCTPGSRRRATAGGEPSPVPSVASKRSSDQLPEQTFERVIEGAHLEQANRFVARETGQGRRDLAGACGLDHEAVAYRVERHATDRI